MLTRRLRQRSAALAEATRMGQGLSGISVWRDLVTAIEQFKKMLQPAAGVSSPSEDVLQRDSSEELHGKFNELCEGMMRFTHEVQNKKNLTEAELTLRREFAPYIHLTQWARRALTKRRRYVGDYLTISWLYDNQAVVPLGPIIDNLFIQRPSSRAVQNRRGLLGEEIALALERGGDSARVMSLACGRAEEIFDVFRANPVSKLKATLIDIDFQALAFVAERRGKSGLTKSIRIECEPALFGDRTASCLTAMINNRSTAAG